MAKLHQLRMGTGNQRVASSFEVPWETVQNVYGSHSVKHAPTMPTFDGGPVNPVANPQVAVIELFETEPAFGRFCSPGFNILVNVDPMEAYRRLVEQQ